MSHDALEYELAGLCMRKALTVPLNPTTLYVKYAFVPIPFRCNNYLSLEQCTVRIIKAKILQKENIPGANATGRFAKRPIMRHPETDSA